MTNDPLGGVVVPPQGRANMNKIVVVSFSFAASISAMPHFISPALKPEKQSAVPPSAVMRAKALRAAAE